MVAFRTRSAAIARSMSGRSFARSGVIVSTSLQDTDAGAVLQPSSDRLPRQNQSAPIGQAISSASLRSNHNWLGQIFFQLMRGSEAMVQLIQLAQ